MRAVTDESLTLLFCALTGTTPKPGEGFSEKEKLGRLQERCLWEIREYSEAEKAEKLCRALEIPIPTVPSDGDILRLYKALTS